MRLNYHLEGSPDVTPGKEINYAPLSTPPPSVARIDCWFLHPDPTARCDCHAAPLALCLVENLNSYPVGCWLFAVCCWLLLLVVISFRVRKFAGLSDDPRLPPSQTKKSECETALFPWLPLTPISVYPSSRLATSAPLFPRLYPHDRLRFGTGGVYGGGRGRGRGQRRWSRLTSSCVGHPPPTGLLGSGLVLHHMGCHLRGLRLAVGHTCTPTCVSLMDG